METSEKKFIRLCKAGKKEGFDLLFEKYEKLIYRLCYHYTASREDSLDLLQEIYIKIYKSIQRFDESQPLIPWIKKIAVNTSLNFIRDSKQNTISLNAGINDEEGTVEDYIASSSSVEDDIGFLDTKRHLQLMIQNLPDDMKMAVILRHINEMSYEEISKVMACPVGTVKTLIYRGRRILKEKLQKSGLWEV